MKRRDGRAQNNRQIKCNARHEINKQTNNPINKTHRAQLDTCQGTFCRQWGHEGNCVYTVRQPYALRSRVRYKSSKVQTSMFLMVSLWKSPKNIHLRGWETASCPFVPKKQGERGRKKDRCGCKSLNHSHWAAFSLIFWALHLEMDPVSSGGR